MRPPRRTTASAVPRTPASIRARYEPSHPSVHYVLRGGSTRPRCAVLPVADDRQVGSRPHLKAEARDTLHDTKRWCVMRTVTHIVTALEHVFAGRAPSLSCRRALQFPSSPPARTTPRPVIRRGSGRRAGFGLPPARCRGCVVGLGESSRHLDNSTGGCRNGRRTP